MVYADVRCGTWELPIPPAVSHQSFQTIAAAGADVFSSHWCETDSEPHIMAKSLAVVKSI